MRILFVTDNFPPETNAVAARVYERAVYWARWGHQVSVITCAPNFPTGRVYPGYRNRLRYVEDMSGIRVIRVGSFMAENAGKYARIADFVSFGMMATLLGLLERRPDVVVATSPQFFAGQAGMVLGLLRRLPFVLELGDLWPAQITAVGMMKEGALIDLLERLELLMYGKAARIVALTHAFRNNLVSRGIPREKIDVVLNGADLDTYAPRNRDDDLSNELCIAPSDFVVGYIGTHGMSQGLENVIRAAALPIARDVRFVFVGSGAERQDLISLASSLGVANAVFVDAQPKSRIGAYWSLCDVALVHLKNVPLFSTVIPSKAFEAMAMGIPILYCGPTGEFSELVLSEEVGIHVPPDDPDRLAEAIAGLAADRACVAALAQKSLESSASHSREQQARLMIAALGDALGL